jgi:hypothetical protein
MVSRIVMRHLLFCLGGFLVVGCIMLVSHSLAEIDWLHQMKAQQYIDTFNRWLEWPSPWLERLFPKSYGPVHLTQLAAAWGVLLGETALLLGWVRKI